MRGRGIAAVLAVLITAGACMAERVWVPFDPGAPEEPGEFEVISSNGNSTVVELTMRKPGDVTRVSVSSGPAFSVARLSAV